jgi:TonB family protein
MRDHSSAIRVRGVSQAFGLLLPLVFLLLFKDALAPSSLRAQETVRAQQTPAPDAPQPAPQAVKAPAHEEPAISEEELRQQLLGKTFYLRDGYLENNLHFTTDGKLDGSSPKASYTLSLAEIQSVRLEKHKLLLEGVRYGLHFFGALASEDQSTALDKVRLTTKKKPLKIEIDREVVDLSVEKKKEKQEAKEAKASGHSPAAPTQSATTSSDPQPQPQPAMETNRHGEVVTTSTAHANAALRQALDHIFSPGIDDRMITSLPAYWQLYYQAVTAKADYRPSDPSVLRESQVDQKARLLKAFDPSSNEYAQANGIAGLAMYHVVVGTDGKAGEIAIGRPIGFGLDENAVEAIRKASFQPALKQGQPVPVLIDLTVQFRIYSGLTSKPVVAEADGSKPESPSLPGPYTANAKQQ